MIVTGGGTGGHLFPGIAVAEGMLARVEGAEVLFVSTDRAMDGQALANRPFARTAISCQPLKGRGWAGKIAGLLGLPASLWQAMRLIRGFNPRLVMGVGGYVTGPVVLAAKILGIATCIHEQNSVPGMANRMLGKIVDRIYISIPGSERFFPAGKTVLTGNPVRRELVAAAEAAPSRWEGGPTLLVLGGSQGAHRVNTLMVEALRKGPLPAGLTVVHQTGKADEEMVRRAYGEAGISARVSAFITDMAEAYSQADLVISRSGATTLAELTVMAKPAIFVPYPYAADDHQTTNARFLVEGGGAKMLVERELDAGRLREEILGLLAAPERLRQMGDRMRCFARPDATGAIVEENARLLGLAA
ncbi:MAG: undecaprenyldiphospho-muramoylpentapeptide beta-N-acetylglucosaminyltransferase [Thermodesulfobacteriota bacterium]